MTSGTPPGRVPRAPGKPSRLPRPASSPLLAKAVQVPGQRLDDLARWWSRLEDAVLLLRAGDHGAAAAGADRLGREVQLALDEGADGAEAQWALLGSTRTVLGLAWEEQKAGDTAALAYAGAVDAFDRAGSWPTRRGDV